MVLLEEDAFRDPQGQGPSLLPMCHGSNTAAVAVTWSYVLLVDPEEHAGREGRAFDSSSTARGFTLSFFFHKHRLSSNTGNVQPSPVSARRILGLGSMRFGVLLPASSYIFEENSVFLFTPHTVGVGGGR